MGFPWVTRDLQNSGFWCSRILHVGLSGCTGQRLHYGWGRVYGQKKNNGRLNQFFPFPLPPLFFFFKWAVWGNHRCPFLLQDLWSLPSFFHCLSLSHHPFFIAQSDHSQWNVKTNYVRALNWPLRPREQVSSVDNAIWTNQRVFIVSRRK